MKRGHVAGLTAAAVLLSAGAAAAHAIGGSDAAFVAAARGADPFPFAYLGAKHMVTGYDHLLFLAGVIFFLTRFRDVALYVTLFSLGHSLTLLAGVAFHWTVDSHLVDAAIGVSVAYKAFDNLAGFQTLAGVRPDPRLAVFGFGLVHGLGLATKLQALRLRPEGLIENLLAFNVGVELGQLVALTGLVAVLALWRTRPSSGRSAVAANALLMTAGFFLTGGQIAAFLLGAPA